MTEHDTKPRSEETGRRDETEIEVTVEMIRAGMVEYRGFNSDFEPPESMLERVFLAMCSAAELKMWTDIAIENQKTYEAVKANALADGMLEVELGHFVKPGEPWEDEHGGRHGSAKNA